MHDVIGDPGFDHPHHLGAICPYALHQIQIQSVVLLKDMAVRPHVVGYVCLGHAEGLDELLFVDEVLLEQFPQLTQHV